MTFERPSVGHELQATPTIYTLLNTLPFPRTIAEAWPPDGSFNLDTADLAIGRTGRYLVSHRFCVPFIPMGGII
jgi:hypothetical protein